MVRATRMVFRHPLPIRITHWINLLALVAMLGSGLQIYNAHPTLYWGSVSADERAWLDIGARRGGQGEWRGYTRLAGLEWETTGVLGLSGENERRAFPAWATIPGPRWLAMGRRWHFFFAWLLVINGLIYLGYSLASRHRRELFPSRAELRGVGGAIRHHLNLHALRADAARGYNVLQKLSYLAVVLVLGPLIVLTGLTMSPTLDSAFPFLLDIFGGRQSARSLHFIAAAGLVLFFLIHIAMVLLVGPVNHLRAMITGRLRIEESAHE